MDKAGCHRADDARVLQPCHVLGPDACRFTHPLLACFLFRQVIVRLCLGWDAYPPSTHYPSFSLEQESARNLHEAHDWVHHPECDSLLFTLYPEPCNHSL
eukprot:286415-Chlamydomonas_euryale.AAC.2